ncbi:MAG: hypothetical protein R3C69_07240 [Geminicoccaceae bacterium]
MLRHPLRGGFRIRPAPPGPPQLALEVVARRLQAVPRPVRQLQPALQLGRLSFGRRRACRCRHRLALVRLAGNQGILGPGQRGFEIVAHRLQTGGRPLGKLQPPRELRQLSTLRLEHRDLGQPPVLELGQCGCRRRQLPLAPADLRPECRHPLALGRLGGNQRILGLGQTPLEIVAHRLQAGRRPLRQLEPPLQLGHLLATRGECRRVRLVAARQLRQRRVAGRQLLLAGGLGGHQRILARGQTLLQIVAHGLQAGRRPLGQPELPLRLRQRRVAGRQLLLAGGLGGHQRVLARGQTLLQIVAHGLQAGRRRSDSPSWRSSSASAVSREASSSVPVASAAISVPARGQTPLQLGELPATGGERCGIRFAPAGHFRQGRFARRLLVPRGGLGGHQRVLTRGQPLIQIVPHRLQAGCRPLGQLELALQLGDPCVDRGRIAGTRRGELLLQRRHLAAGRGELRHQGLPDRALLGAERLQPRRRSRPGRRRRRPAPPGARSRCR